MLKQKKGACSSTTSKRNPSNIKQEHQQENVVLCPVAEKVVLYQESPTAMKSNDDLTTKTSSRTKQSHQGAGTAEYGLPKVSGLLFPSVKTDGIILIMFIRI